MNIDVGLADLTLFRSFMLNTKMFADILAVMLVCGGASIPLWPQKSMNAALIEHGHENTRRYYNGCNRMRSQLLLYMTYYTEPLGWIDVNHQTNHLILYMTLVGKAAQHRSKYYLTDFKKQGKVLTWLLCRFSEKQQQVQFLQATIIRRPW